MSSTPDYSPARVLLRAADQRPDRLSLACGLDGPRWTVGESAQTVRRLATLLEDALASGERIAIIGPNSPWHFLVHVAASWHHQVTVPLSPRLPLSQLHALVEDCQAGLVVTTPELREAMLASPGAHQPSHVWTFEELENRCSDSDPMEGLPTACSEELGAVVYTSGSSGAPRGVELSHRQMWWASMSFRDGFEYCPGTDVIGVCAPLSHIGGFNGTTLDAFSHGGTVVVIPAFEPSTVLRCIEGFGVTQMFLVPVMCHLLADAQRSVNADLSSYRNPLIGGDSMGADVEQRLRGMGLSPIHVWGMTETGGAGAMLSPDMFADHTGAIGRPFPYVDLRLVDDSGAVVSEPGVMGEIQVSGPGVCQSYYNRPADTQAAFDGPWLRTGDLATLDEDGYVHMVGRASRMIHTAGEIVPPRRVEEALRSCPGVADALVVGVADERWGQLVSAVLVPSSELADDSASAEGAGAGLLPRSPGAFLDEAALAAVREHTASFLAPWEVVRRAKWVEALPLTSTGKPDPQAARDMLSE